MQKIKQFPTNIIRKINKKYLDTLLISFILIITFFANLNLFSVPFIYDDYDFLFHWPAIRDFSRTPDLLLGDLPVGHEGVYRPVRSIFYMLSLNSFGHKIFLYHIQELIVYSLCVILVYLIIQKMFNKRSLSFLTSLIFALLPIHIDNIANLTASFDSIGVVFFFLSFHLFQVYLDSKNHHLKLLLASLLSAVIAFFTYELTLILPIILLIYTYFIHKKKSAVIFILFISAVILYLIIRINLHIPLRGSYSENIQAKIIDTTQTIAALPVYTISPIKVEAPTLSAEGYFLISGTKEKTAYHTGNYQMQLFFISIIFLITVITVSIRSLLRRQLSGFGLTWFFICVIPAIAISLQSNLTGEGQVLWGKYLIIASLGMSLFTASWLLKLLKTKPISPVLRYIKLVCLTIISLIIISYPLYNSGNLKNWRNPTALLLEEINRQKNEDEKKHNDLGVIHALDANYSVAAFEFKKALQINPKYTKAKINLNKLCEFIKKLPNSALNIHNSCPKP